MTQAVDEFIPTWLSTAAKLPSDLVRRLDTAAHSIESDPDAPDRSYESPENAVSNALTDGLRSAGVDAH